MSIDLAFDRQHLWHPYTSLHNPLPVYPVTRADGCLLTLADGRQLVDGTSSWWAAVHGYNHPELNQAITTQLSQMSHVMFGGITHQPAIELGKLLLAMLPTPLAHIFYADSGSIAVEVALKMALQYHLATGQRQKTKILSLRKAYHGDTFAAMSVCDPVDGMHQLFSHQLPQQLFAPAPTRAFADTWQDSDASAWRAMFAAHHHEIAAFIVEPVLQGAGGMRLYHPAYLTLARQLCDEYGVLLIFDEIATGFGRTGQLFAMQHAGVVPDIVTLGKALSGGYLSLGATVCSNKVAAGISQGEPGALMHGPTFMANPLACAVAAASLRLLAQNHWQAQVSAIEQHLQQHLLPLASCAQVKSVRVLGAVGIIEMRDVVDVAKAQAQMVAAGVWVRPFANLIYLMPPFTISSSELSQLTSAVTAIVAADILRAGPTLPGA